MPGENNGEKQESKEGKESWWKSRAFTIPLAVGIIVVIVGGFFQFILPRLFPEEPSPIKPVPVIQYNSTGNPLLEIIRHVEGETDFDVVTTREVEEFKVFGEFEGDDWLHILKKVLNTCDRQLKFNIDEKDKKITIGFRSPGQTKSN